MGVEAGEGVVGEKVKQEKPPAGDYFFKDQEASQSGASNSGNNCIDFLKNSLEKTGSHLNIHI